MKKNKGITLIALVITIIVLLILAGVAIAMLSGENGILKKAAEAKIKTKEVQEDEETALIDMELNTHFIEKNARYRCSYGYITGVTAIKDGILGYKTKDKVSDLQKALPSGYIVKCKYEYGANYKLGEDKDITEDIELMTGMGIAKKENEKIVARVVVFGDVNCDGKINFENDAASIVRHYGDVSGIPTKDFSVVAMDVNHDGYIGNIDYKLVSEAAALKEDVNFNDYQKGTATSFKKISKKSEIEIKKDYTSKLEMKNSSYKWTVDGGVMYLDGATTETAGSDLIDELGLKGKAYVGRSAGKGQYKEITTDNIKSGDKIFFIEPYYSYGSEITELAEIYIE